MVSAQKNESTLTWQKVVALVCALVFGLLALTGCATLNDPETTDPSNATPSEAPSAPSSVYCKDSATADENREVVVGTLGEYTLTNGQLQVMYKMKVAEYINLFNGYIQYAGIDLTKPLGQQYYDEKTGLTWEAHFLQEAIAQWVDFCVVCIEADQAGFVMPQEYADYLAGLEQTLTKTAEEAKFESVDDLIKSELGSNVRYGDYYAYMLMYYKSNLYINDLMEKMEISDTQLEEYFTKNETSLQNEGVTKTTGDYVDIRHILIMPEGGVKGSDGYMVYTDEEWEACRIEAQKIYDQWLNGEKTEDSFGALANEKSQDQNGQVTNGGLYENVYINEMVKAFNDWCFDETRQPGDHGLVQTEYGYHIMYFVAKEPIWVRYCREGAKNDSITVMIEELVDASQWDTQLDKVVLEEVKLA